VFNERAFIVFVFFPLTCVYILYFAIDIIHFFHVLYFMYHVFLYFGPVALYYHTLNMSN